MSPWHSTFRVQSLLINITQLIACYQLNLCSITPVTSLRHLVLLLSTSEHDKKGDPAIFVILNFNQNKALLTIMLWELCFHVQSWVELLQQQQRRWQLQHDELVQR